MTSAILKDVELENLSERLVLLGRFQAVAGGTGCAAFDVRVDDIKPSAVFGFRIGFTEVGESDLVGEVGFFH